MNEAASTAGASNPRAAPARRLLGWAAAAALIVAAALAFDNPYLRAAPLLGPFLSGAANLELGKGWRYSVEDVQRYAALPDDEARARFRFERRPDAELRPYELSSEGLVYVIWAARGLLPWMGDLQALEWLQIAIHVGLTLLVATRFREPVLQAAFVILYGANPLVLHTVTYPYYYFWQVVPTAILAAYLLDRRFRLGRWAPAVAVLLAGTHAIRPTGLLASMFLFVLVTTRESWRLGAASLAILLVVALGFLSGAHHGKDPWHTAYIAIGAHPNPYVASYRDGEAFEEFTRRTGETVDLSPTGNFYDPAFRRRLSEVTREAYLEIVRSDPLLIVRNAVLNYFQSFSIGHFVGRSRLNQLSTGLGVLCFVWLVWRRRFLFVAAVTAAGATFVPYTAPVVLYLFGHYVLLVAAVIDTMRDFVPGQRTASSLEAPGAAPARAAR